MPITCEVNFDNNPAKVVYAGQMLSGTVRLTSTGYLNVRSIFIRIQGTAHTQWEEGTGEKSRTFTGDEVYLNERTYFVNRTTFYAGGEVPLLPGGYTYKFQCMLPPNLPTSFEGEFGHIRYFTRVVIDIPLLPDQTFEQPFTVIKAVNLNADPALRVPVIIEKHKTFSPLLLCCCKSSRPMTIVAKIPYGGYTPGQTINLECNVKNDSDQPASKFTIKLVKQVTYYVCENSTRQKDESITIFEMETRGCDVGKEENYRVNLEVPSIPPSDFSTSNIIKVKYSIRIIGSVPVFHINPILDIPITIGTYPIQEAPPSYVETMHSVTNVDSEHFTPKYPMFSQTSASSHGN